MESISVSKAKTHFLEIVENVRSSGEEVVVTKNGEPAVVIRPVVKESKRKFGFGYLKDEIQIVGDIISPIAEDDWEVLKD